MEKSNDIEISIMRGEKLFNPNTPFAINLTTPEPDENDKKSNVDLICVIDISGSMFGTKIEQVKESLKILINLMDEKDRICLILFSSTAENYFDLDYLTKQKKKFLTDRVNQIEATGGTNILSGLQEAIQVLKKHCNKEKNVSSILLLSDGKDNELNNVELAESLKNLTKGLGLSFTLNTFGYGDDHDALIMNKLASIRDGSFFYVENYRKITEYFVSILGGCMSVISKKVDLNLQILNNNCKIKKVYGKDNLFSHLNNENYFKTTMLQFICGKEYTFVLEILIDENNIQIHDEILKVEIMYEDISQNNKKIKKEKKYIYSLKDLNYIKANEEYIRVYVYDTLDQALKLKEKNQDIQGKRLLDKLENWLLKNYKGKNDYYIKDIQDAKGMFSKNRDITLKSFNFVNSSIKENSLKRTGNSFKNCNSIQINMLRSVQVPLNPIIEKSEIPSKSYINTKYSRINYVNMSEPQDNVKNFMNRNHKRNLNRAPLPINNNRNLNRERLPINYNGNLNRSPLPINSNFPHPYAKRIIPINRPISSKQNQQDSFPNDNFINPLYKSYNFTKRNNNTYYNY